MNELVITPRIIDTRDILAPLILTLFYFHKLFVKTPNTVYSILTELIHPTKVELPYLSQRPIEPEPQLLWNQLAITWQNNAKINILNNEKNWRI